MNFFCLFQSYLKLFLNAIFTHSSVFYCYQLDENIIKTTLSGTESQSLNGHYMLTLKMYIDAGFGAISQQNINEGSFSAVANFTIEYE